MSQTFYLKYRPQKISDLDLDSVREQLQKIAASGRTPHAFLFSGPRGAGKTSTARIVAKLINCEEPTNDHEPCNECAQCQAITRGGSLDVVEIDAASNRGVEDIRLLRETVKLAPIGSKKKVYIIDEAHMLTTEAANALLKTLEEPPDHAVFILATTAPEKLLDTIRSRCTLISFYKGRKAEVIRALEKVVEGEKLKVEDDALVEIAGSVDGSFREAHKMLEQLSFSGEKITKEAIQALSAASFSDPATLLALLTEGKVKLALAEIEKLVNQGVNLKVYLTQIISALRKSLLARLGVLEGEVIAGLEVTDHCALIELFSQAARQYPTALIPQLPLEVAVVKWCVGLEEQPRAVRLDEEKTGERREKRENEARSKKNEVVSESKKAEKEKDIISDHLASKIQHPISKLSPAELEDLWPRVMKLTKEKNHSVEALLRAARPVAFDGKILQIEVFYKFHKESLEREPYRSVVEEVTAALLGGPLRLVCVLTEGKRRAADIANISAPGDLDLVKVAEDIFGAQGSDGKVH